MGSKKIFFKVRDIVVEEVDGEDITVDEVEMTKSCLAHLHGVTYDEIEIDTEDTPEKSKTMFVTGHMGLCYKAPNEYSVFRTVDTPVLAKTYDFRFQDHIDEFLDELSFYLKQKSCKEFDDFIIFL